MVPEAPLERRENGLQAKGEGWFVLNARDAPWFEGDFGLFALLEGEQRFEQLGFGLGILRPGEANALYHGEDAEEDFLVLSGECLLLVDGQERRLGAWDFVHCPPWTEHIFVGAGEGPCLVAAVGARRQGRGIGFPVNELALRYRAGVEKATDDPKEAYAEHADDMPVPCPPEFPPA